MVNEQRYLEKKQAILDFITTNSSKYGEKVTFGLYSDVFTDICLEMKKIPIELNQILSKFGVYEEGDDVYSEMFKILDKYSFLQGSCCEIGAGDYPRLAELTASKLKLNGGSLTIYDPDILFGDMQDMTIVREKFNKSTNVDKFDTLYGLFPCEATIDMAEKAFEEDKNLLIAFCGCDHSTIEHPKWVGKYWAEDFCMDYREKYGKEAEIIKWPSHIGLDLPIMIRHSSKNKSKVK